MRPALILSVCLLFSIKIAAQTPKFKNDTAKESMDLTPPTVYTYTEQMPEPGYDITKYLSEHLQYPDSAYKYNVQGRVVLKFIVNEDGSISDCKIEKGIGAGCDEEALKEVSSMPKWKAGMKNGLPVRVWTMLPVSFVLTKKIDSIHTYVDQMPRPDYDLNKFITGYQKYIDSMNSEKGNVIVRFVVSENGKPGQSVILQGTGDKLDNEALNIVNNMPPFRPGKQNGKPVKTYYTVDISFNAKSDSDFVSNKEDHKPKSNSLNKKQPIESDTSRHLYPLDVHYPEFAKENNITGQVLIGFVVNEDGVVSDCSVLKGIGGGCDEEVVKAIRKMPTWKPGKKDGKPIKMYFTLPFSFNLE